MKSEELVSRLSIRRELACLFRLEPKSVILYSDFVEDCGKYAYPGTVKTVPYELTDLLRVKF